MKKQWVVAAALAGVLVLPAVARAHSGHVHKVTGTVTSAEDTRVVIRTTDGKTVTVTLNGKTTFERGTQKVDAKALEPGQRVVVDVGDGKEPLVARGFKLGVVEAKK